MSENQEVNSFAPQVLDHVTGQQQIVQRVKVALEYAWHEGAAFPSALMTGPPGLGKSLMAQVIAKEMGCELRQTLAQNLSNLGELHGFLMEAGDKDVLFIDEADELKQQAQTVLYRSLEDRVLFVPKGTKSSGGRTIPLARFTLLAASNHESSLVEPLRDRFKLLLRFSYYNDSEICDLLRQRAKALGWQVNDDVFPLIALRSRGTPRVALRIMEAARRYCLASDGTIIDQNVLFTACLLEGLDEKGLDEVERRYLTLLAEAKGPMRLNVLAMRLGNIPTKTVSKVVEAFLIRDGFVTKSDSGRELTPKGWEHLKSVSQNPNS